MGQKVHPYGFRLGFNKPWRSRWFAKQGYAKLLQEDLELKEALRQRLKSAGVSSIEVDRPGNKLRVTIRTSRPGIIIGRKGAEIEKLKQDMAKNTKREVFIDIQEVHKPELDAQLVTESIALQLEKRVAFRRAMRKAVDSALRFGCKGIKVRVSGRLNGAEIARSEWYLQGQLPLHTLRADIDYGFTEAHTTYGVIGIKAWLYKGEILDTWASGWPAANPSRDAASSGNAATGARVGTGVTVLTAASAVRMNQLPRWLRRWKPRVRPCSRLRAICRDRAAGHAASAAADVAAPAVLEAGSETGTTASGRRRRGAEIVVGGARCGATKAKVNNHDDAEEGQIQKAAARTHGRQGLARFRAFLWRVRAEGHGVRLDHGPADRGRPCRDDALHQARRQSVDPAVPGQADHQEAG